MPILSSDVTRFTDSNFDAEVLQSSQPVLVDFSATWCGPCRAIAPLVAALARDYAGRVKMGQLNVDDCPRVATQFDVRALPTLLLFKDGQVIGQIVGAVARPRIETLLQRHV
jgi:thioredoxin 1